MRTGVHVVRNPRIYARLSDAGLTTRAGTGIRRILYSFHVCCRHAFLDLTYPKTPLEAGNDAEP